jgi:hypothetical protein
MNFELLILNELNLLDIHPSALTIKPIVDLWNNDKSKDKKQALQELAFIYWMYNWNSLYYRDYPDEQERLGMVISEVFQNIGWTPTLLVTEAAKIYQRLQEEAYPGLTHLQTARNTLGKLKVFLDNIDPDSRTNAGGLILKPADIYTAISKMGDALIAVEKMEEKIKREMQLEESKVYGGGKAGAFEDETNINYLKK